MAVDPGAEERREVGPVASGEGLEASRELELGHRIGQPERARPKLRGDVGEQRVDVPDRDRREHPAAIIVRVRAIGHRVSPRR